MDSNFGDFTVPPDQRQRVKQLIKVVKDRNETSLTRRKAVLTLGELGDRQAVDTLIGALQDEHWFFRDAANLRLMSLSQDKHTYEAHINPIRDVDDELRANAAHALGQVGDKRAVKPLINVLKGDAELVLQEAAEALGKIGDKRAVEPLLQILKDENASERVRFKATQALGKIGGWKVVEELLQLLKGENPNMRMAAASALGETGDGRALLDLVWTQYNDFAPTSWGQNVADAAAEAVHKIEERRKG